MNKQLLKMFYAFIVTAIMFSVIANAQIIYTDVNPDVAKTCSVAIQGGCSAMDSIDLNNDGDSDLKLMLLVSKIRPIGGVVEIDTYVKAYPLNGSAIRTNSSGYPLYMNLNDVIDTSGNASTTADQILIYRTYVTPGPVDSSGSWITATDGFLGLKIISGSQINYCWVRLSVAANISGSATFTIKDFAYNSIPDHLILAGDTGSVPTGIIKNIASSSINLFPNPATDKLTIALGINNRKVEVTIADITGKIIYKTTATNSEKAEVITQDFPTGIYVVQIQSADFIATKKLVIEK